ncbi:MAG: PA2169 family four-helix-bundle protein, partial [Burkholderiaceae bacterium]|nr:PA2169 family four-helix-bundle protein [Burkholderiaceae bacterium]
LESARDGEYGFHACADHADDDALKGIFQRHSRECAAAAQELEQEVLRLDGEPASGGTVAGALHRGWVSVKSAVATHDDNMVLEECERGEDAAVARYRNALRAGLPTDVRTLIERQSQGAQRNHDEVRALRDRFVTKT